MVAWSMQVAASVVGWGGADVVCAGVVGEGFAAAEVVGAIRGCGDVRAGAVDGVVAAGAGCERDGDGVLWLVPALWLALALWLAVVLVLELCETFALAGAAAEPEAVD
jgi:hypothetical protein